MNEINEEVKQVLQNSTITENTLVLPDTILDRKLYLEVNKHIDNCGGKWDRKSKSHIFKNGTAKLLECIESGVTISEKQELQAFFTPQKLAERVVDLAEIHFEDWILEPSAGKGAIADEISKHEHRLLDVIDIHKPYVEILESKEYYGNVFCKDFLEYKSKEHYDKIIMNPPFTKKQWLKHTQHAYNLLKDNGILVAIIPNTPDPKFHEWLDDKDYEIFDVEDGAFRESGTMVRTVILKIKK